MLKNCECKHVRIFLFPLSSSSSSFSLASSSLIFLEFPFCGKCLVGKMFCQTCLAPVSLLEFLCLICYHQKAVIPSFFHIVFYLSFICFFPLRFCLKLAYKGYICLFNISFLRVPFLHFCGLLSFIGFEKNFNIKL